MPPFDVVVVGLGAMGSAAVYEVARRGIRVLGIDAHSLPHTLGSTHGRTRIIREAYFEHPLYVPLVQHAYARWAELETASGEQLFVRTGGAMIGPRDGALVSGSLGSARAYGLAHELLDAAAMRRRWPVMRPDDDMAALVEPRAGVLFPERCIEAYLRLARGHGATLSMGERVERWDTSRDGITVTTAMGKRYTGGRLILAAGPWLPRLLDIPLGLQVERQLFHWFEARENAEALRADRLPIALWEFARDRFVATLPDLGDGLKAGIHHEGEITDPERVRRTPDPEDEAAVRALLARLLPASNGRLREARVCLYTNTPDHHFLIDHHPGDERIVIASPCSGHGFKFASAIGEVLADLATTGASRFDLSAFGIERLLTRRRSATAAAS